jgi:hypothetical protein
MSTYGFSPSTRAVVVLAMAMVGLPLIGILLYCFLGLPATKVQITLLILSTLLVIPLVSMLRFYARTRDQIIASEEGLTYHPYTGNSFSISWSQVADLRPHTLRNRYDVVDHQGQRLLTISYELEKIEDLGAIIQKHLQGATLDKHLTYHVKRPGGTIMLWLLPLFLVQMPFIGLTPQAVFILFLLPIGAVWALFFDTRRVKIDSQGLTIEYLLRSDRLSFNNVRGAELDGEGPHAWHTMRIERIGQKPFKFVWPIRNGDSMMIRKTIEDNWRAFIHEKQTNA